MLENKTTATRMPLETLYVVQGSAEYVRNERDRLMRDYPPQGYGTRASIPVVHQGGIRVVITRSNSCD